MHIYSLSVFLSRDFSPAHSGGCLLLMINGARRAFDSRGWQREEKWQAMERRAEIHILLYH